MWSSLVGNKVSMSKVNDMIWYVFMNIDVYFKMCKKHKTNQSFKDVDHHSASVIIHEFLEVPLQAAGYSAGVPLYEGGNPTYIVTCSLMRLTS